LPWFHLVTILIRISDDAERDWYAAQTIQHGWSRPTLDVHIKNQLQRRQEIAVTNFDRRLPTPHARLAGEVLKDPYLFDFLGLGDASVGPVMQSKNRQRDSNHSGRADEPLTRSLGLKLT
jgi:predicted nuclease of restriction endonuclease-like (RecB) superfamily